MALHCCKQDAIASCQILGGKKKKKNCFASFSAGLVIHLRPFSNKLFGPTCTFMWHVTESDKCLGKQMNMDLSLFLVKSQLSEK